MRTESDIQGTGPRMSPEQLQYVGGWKPATPSTQTAAPAPVVEPGRNVSAAARDALGNIKVSRMAHEVLDAARAAHRSGKVDVTSKELQFWFRHTNPGKDIDTGPLAGRINELISARLLERLPKRLCTISKVAVGPVRVVARQARLVD